MPKPACAVFMSFPEYSARTAGRFADLIDQLVLECRQTVLVRSRSGKERADALVGGAVGHEIIHDSDDSGFATEPIVERFLRVGRRVDSHGESKETKR